MLSLLFKKKNEEQGTTLESNPLKYKRINFFNDFKNIGYVQKVICMYEDVTSIPDTVYFNYSNDRATTDIPCIDKEIFIISDYNKENGVHTYTLVQIDFSMPIKYKVLISKDSATGLYKYIRENRLVEIKDNPAIKQPQIDFGYGKIVIEILDTLDTSDKNIKKYNETELFALILQNVKSSKYFMECTEDGNYEKIMYLRVKNKAMHYLDIIFDNCNKDILTINEALNYGKKYQNNYYYNI